MLLQSSGGQSSASVAASMEMCVFVCFREPSWIITEFVFVTRLSTVQIFQGLWCKFRITLQRYCISVLVPGKFVKVVEVRTFLGWWAHCRFRLTAGGVSKK